MKMPHWPNPIGYRDVDLGLSRVYRLLEKLGDPHLKLPPVIHIAGTNGKGSTIAFINSILNDAGYKNHIYTSPNLVQFNERIVIAGEEISDSYLSDILDRCSLANGDDKITFFEGVTVAALLAFSENDADFVLLETGLGGRLDSTNVIDKPIQTILTPISMDHQDFLGNDIAKIAYEKCGIIKKDVNCITSTQSNEVMRVIKDNIESKEANLIIAKNMGYNEIELGLKGDFQKINADTAVCAIKNLNNINISEDNIKNGLKNAIWKGRFQKLSSEDTLCKLPEYKLPENFSLYIDGGHNVAAASIINNEIRSDKNMKWHLIIGMLKDKDAEGFIKNITSNIEEDQNIVTCYNVAIPNEEKSYKSNELYEITKNYVSCGFDCSSIEEAFAEIVTNDDFRDCKNNILICGSLYLVGDVLEKIMK